MYHSLHKITMQQTFSNIDNKICFRTIKLAY